MTAAGFLVLGAVAGFVVLWAAGLLLLLGVWWEMRD